MGSVAKAFYSEPQTLTSEVSQAVSAQLERVLSDDLFNETTRMKRFLRYVVDETLEGRADRLKGYTIGVAVFDRPETFDPQIDTIVRVQAGQLRRRLDLYYAYAGLNDSVRFVIPKGQYAPVFEMRRNTLTTTAVEAEPSATPAINTIQKVEAQGQTRPGIAVLTFDDLNEGAESDFFAEGLTTEIINALVQFRYLRIVSCTPSVEWRKRFTDIRSLAKEYDVQFILNGSVRRVDGVFRVWVDLLSAETGEHLFSKTLDKEYIPAEIFDLQEEIASYTAAKVAAPYGVVNRFNRRANVLATEKMPAYEVVLRYYNMKHSPLMSELLILQEQVESVTQKYPKYSPALAIRSHLKSYQVSQSLSDIDREKGLDEALAFAERAVYLEPDSAFGYMALYKAHYHKGNFIEADRMAQRSIALNPNDYAMLAYYSCTCAYHNEPERALAYHEASLRLIDSPPPWFYFCKIILAFRERKFEYALSLLPTEVSLDSAMGIQRFALAAMGHLGLMEQASTLLAKFRKAHSDYDHKLVSTLAMWHPDAALHEIFIDGLRRAGLMVDV